MSLLPQEPTLIGGSGSGGQLGVIVKWDLKKKKKTEKDKRLVPLLSLNKDGVAYV